MPEPLRQRRRAAATREILDAARAQIAEHGPAALALRSIARSLGMTVQALYHYFASRDELITALITEAYHDLADAVEAALDATPEGEPARFVVAATAFRAWSVGDAARFQLIYGTPLARYQAPPDGRTTAGARRLAAVFSRELLGAFTTGQLSHIDFPPLSSELRTRLDGLPKGSLGELPAPAAALFVSTWGHLHGLVTLEVFGHTAFIGPLQEEIFGAAVRGLVADAHRRIPPP